MPPLTFIQSNAAGVSTGNTVSVSFTSPTTLNSFLIAATQSTLVGQTFTLTDNVNGAWQLIDSNSTVVAEDWRLYIVPKNLGGSITATLTASSSSGFVNLVIAEYTGQIQTGSPIDVFTVFAQQGPSTSVSFGPITTTQPNEEMIWIGWTATGIQWFAGSGYTARQDGTFAVGAVLMDSGTLGLSPGSVSFTATSGSSQSLYGWFVGVIGSAPSIPNMISRPSYGSDGSATFGRTVVS